MKIIAKTDGGYLLDVGNQELANLLGLTYEHQIPKDVAIGSTLDIVKASDAAQFLRSLDPEKIKRIKKHFVSISEQFDEMSDVVQGLILLDTIKNV